METSLIPPPEEPACYRPVSAIAVAALVGGLVSAAALASPFFWVLPLIAIGLAWMGLADTSRPGAEKAGRSAALIGLALAVGFGAQAVSRTAALQWIMSSRARTAALLWVDALRSGRIDDAQKMCQPNVVLQVGQLSSRLGACGTGANARATAVTASDEAPDQWLVRAVIEPCAPGPIGLEIRMMREEVPENQFERWKVVQCDAW